MPVIVWDSWTCKRDYYTIESVLWFEIRITLNLTMHYFKTKEHTYPSVQYRATTSPSVTKNYQNGDYNDLCSCKVRLLLYKMQKTKWKWNLTFRFLLIGLAMLTAILKRKFTVERNVLWETDLGFISAWYLQ